MKKRHLLKSVQSIVLIIAMIAILFTAPVIGVSAEETGNTIKVFQSHDCWTAMKVSNTVSVTQGKTYTFTLLWRDIWTKGTTMIKIGNTTILSGKYEIENGASYNPYTGKISYTFTAESDTVEIVLDNLFNNNNKYHCYKIADPKMFESDSSGTAKDGGDVVDCNPDFRNWSKKTWGEKDVVGDSDFTVYDGTASEFPTRHSQPGDGKVYVFTAGGTGANQWGRDEFVKKINVIAGKTYTFSMLWKAGSNDKTQVIIGGTKIINGYYNLQNGAIFDPYTGRVSYTFTADSDTVKVDFYNIGDNIQRKNYSFADPSIVESDVLGNTVINGDIADCDIDFCTSQWDLYLNYNKKDGWNKEDYVSIGDISDFSKASKDYIHTQPEGGEEDVVVFTYNKGWDKRIVSFDCFTAIAGKTYTFSILWKNLGDCKTIVRVGGVNILEGDYNTVNGATFDPNTGRLSYTFTAASMPVTVEFDNANDDNKYNKNYSIADPKMYETDENGNPVTGGDIIDCDVDFCPEKWMIYDSGNHKYITTDNDLSVTDGYSSDFVIRHRHKQLDSETDVYALSHKYSYDQLEISYSPFVFKGRTYTFSMLYRVYGNTTTRISVNGTKILDGDYNVQNGAKYDPYTGRIYYTFNATDTKAKILLDNLGSEDNQKYHSYEIADPQLIETDGNGNRITNGDIADCDVDFCGWVVKDYKHAYNTLDARIERAYANFALRHQPHAQAENGVYVLSYDWNMWDVANLFKEVFVLSGKTYTFSMLWRDNTKNTIISIDGKQILNGETLLNGATYNSMTGLLTYTFVASKYNIKIELNNHDESRKNHSYSIGNPLMYESDLDGKAIENGDVVDCDVDFCEWKQERYEAITDPGFTVTIDTDWFFMHKVVFGDLNGDGKFNILDLVAAKKALAGTRKEAVNLLSIGYDSYATEIVAEDLVYIRQLLLGNANFRTKAELKALLSTLHNRDAYAIGYHVAASTKISDAIMTFSEKLGGKPAFVDYDMCSLPYISSSNEEYLIAQLARFNSIGGFVALSAHWLVPTEKLSDSSNYGANNSRYSLTAEQYTQVYTEGTKLNVNFREELKKESDFILKLKNLGINVIFRPLHESNYGSFWWCSNSENGITPDMVAQLYNYVYNYFTNECGLDNIVWQFNIDSKKSSSGLISPGNVDILGIDCYLNGGSANEIKDDYIKIQQACGDKVVVISEFFSSDDAAYSDFRGNLDIFTSDLTYKFAYLGIYCSVNKLKPAALPDNALTLSDISGLNR